MYRGAPLAPLGKAMPNRLATVGAISGISERSVVLPGFTPAPKKMSGAWVSYVRPLP